MPRIIRSAPAKADLRAIWNHIAIENPDAADSLLDEINDAVKLIALQPGVGTSVDNLAPGCRRFVVHRNYLIYFRPIQGGVQIVRVLHGARNIHSGYFQD